VSLQNRHTLGVLEYERVLALVQARAPSSLGKSALAGEVPTPLRDECLLRQRRTAQMRQLLEGEADLTWGGSRDISPQLERLRVEGSWIEPPALLRVAAFAVAARRVRRTIEDAGAGLPDLGALASGIPEYGGLAGTIRRCINHEGEVADSASPELGRIRRGLEKVRRDLLRTLERYFEASGSASAIQEKIVTRREERYVIPVKAGSRGAVPGLVHDRSASGQTLYIEPAGVVEKNNTLRELTAAEREEILRILKELGALVRGLQGELEAGMTAMAALEAVWARALYAAEFDMTEPVIFEEEGRLELTGASHPLLLKSLGPDTVPIDFSLGGQTKTLVLTGPNTGGKTVALKTLGLLCLMAQSGLQIPALPGSGMSCFREILADIGDEQSLQQNLSTFSGHMKNVIHLVERSAPGSLVLLDEIGAGTDPSEGAALGIAILEETLDRGALTVATTHHNAVKVFASAATGVANASMEFDSATLRPTYRLVTGVPGRSQAFHIAAGLGLAGSIIERARSHQDAGEVRLDGLMADLEEERRSVAAERAALAGRERLLEEEERRRAGALERKREKIEEEGRRALREAERELTASLRGMKKEQSRPAARKVKGSMEKVKEVLREYVPAPAVPTVDAGALRVGDRVFVRTLRTWAVVEEVDREKITATIDGKRCSVPAGEIAKKEVPSGSPGKEHRTAWGSYSVEVPPMASAKIDLRGLRVEEALARLGRFIEHALLNHLPGVSVIHGKGTGSLQQAVGGYLEDHGGVESFEMAPLEQGGTGVTQVRLS
jgi:DNA mismatch repair protein MutS2